MNSFDNEVGRKKSILFKALVVHPDLVFVLPEADSPVVALVGDSFVQLVRKEKKVWQEVEIFQSGLVHKTASFIEKHFPVLQETTLSPKAVIHSFFSAPQ